LKPFNLFLLSVILGGIGAGMLVIHFDFDPPAETDLVRVTGDIDTIVIADVLADPENKFDTPLPWNSIFIKLKGAPQEYRYKGGWPNFDDVYKVGMSSSVDIWIDARQLGTGDPLYIYQIVERNPFREVVEVLHVKYQDLVTTQEAIVLTYRKVGGWLLGIGVLLAVLGLLALRYTVANQKTRVAFVQNPEAAALERHNERAKRRIIESRRKPTVD